MRVVTSDQLRQFTADEAALSRGGLGGMKREAPPSVADDDKRRLVVLPYRMTPADEAANGARFVGAMANGKHVYEIPPKKPCLYNQGVLSLK